jgi:hypothetical protein
VGHVTSSSRWPVTCRSGPPVPPLGCLLDAVRLVGEEQLRALEHRMAGVLGPRRDLPRDPRAVGRDEEDVVLPVAVPGGIAIVGDPLPVRRPRGVLAPEPGDARGRAAFRRDLPEVPDIVVERQVEIGVARRLERDPLAVRRPGGSVVVGRVHRQGAGPARRQIDDDQVAVPRRVAREGDLPSVRRPAGLLFVGGRVGEPLRRAALRGADPDVAVPVERDALAVGGQGGMAHPADLDGGGGGADDADRQKRRDPIHPTPRITTHDKQKLYFRPSSAQEPISVFPKNSISFPPGAS